MNARFYQKADERKKLLEETSLYPAWKVFKYGVISGPYFPVFGLKFSPNTGKYGPETTPYLDTFHAVVALGKSTDKFYPYFEQLT